MSQMSAWYRKGAPVVAREATIKGVSKVVNFVDPVAFDAWRESNTRRKAVGSEKAQRDLERRSQEAERALAFGRLRPQPVTDFKTCPDCKQDSWRVSMVYATAFGQGDADDNSKTIRCATPGCSVHIVAPMSEQEAELVVAGASFWLEDFQDRHFSGIYRPAAMVMSGRRYLLSDYRRGVLTPVD